MLLRRPKRSQGWLTKAAVVAVTLVAAAMITPAARAQTYVTPGGSTDTAGDPVSASATFTVTSGQIVVTLNNLEVNQKDAGQLLTDLSFTVSGGTLPSLSGAAAQLGTANLILVASDGTVTPDGTNQSIGWGYTTSNSNTQAELNGLNGANTPSDTIIGPPNGSGVYSNANPSIAGNGPHNPFASESATFTITGSGITGGTTIASATFSFGTTSGDNIDGVLTTPEPSTIVLAGLGALGFIGFGLRRRLKK